MMGGQSRLSYLFRVNSSDYFQVNVDIKRDEPAGNLKLKMSYLLFFADQEGNVVYSEKSIRREEEINARDSPNGELTNHLDAIEIGHNSYLRVILIITKHL